jgi:ABC-2 type transport system ATP-binding protein
MTTAGIMLVDVRKSFGEVHAVAGIGFRVDPGEVVALLGPNGAGKTTTLDIILGLQRPDSGLVEVTGTSPRAALDAGRVGSVLQTGDMLKGLTVAELVRSMSALQPRPLALPEVVERAGLGDILPRRVEKLSGGETQRVRFALAIVGDPQLLVLDEPTAAMDVSARRAFWSSIRQYAELGRTVLFSTHYLEEADAVADRIILLGAGRVVADGPATAIRAVTAGRLVRCTLPGVEAAELRRLPGVESAETLGRTVAIRTGAAEATVRALLNAYAEVDDLEVVAAPLADAVFALTEEAAGAGTLGPAAVAS